MKNWEFTKYFRTCRKTCSGAEMLHFHRNYEVIKVQIQRKICPNMHFMPKCSIFIIAQMWNVAIVPSNRGRETLILKTKAETLVNVWSDRKDRVSVKRAADCLYFINFRHKKVKLLGLRQIPWSRVHCDTCCDTLTLMRFNRLWVELLIFHADRSGICPTAETP